MNNSNNNSKQNVTNAITKILFWNVDTQYDFMRDDASFKGSLPVKNARAIEGNLEKLTNLAEQHNVKVVNTADWHYISDLEINSVNPDYKNTYPEHCMAETTGAKYVPATNPKNPYFVAMNDSKDLDENKILSYRNLVLHKDKFDVFAGNIHMDKVLELLNPEKVFVYGVATNVCVNFAVQGLLKRNYQVYVVSDAIKELPNEIAATPLEDVLVKWQNKNEWNGNAAKLVTVNDVEQMFNTQYDMNNNYNKSDKNMLNL